MGDHEQGIGSIKKAIRHRMRNTLGQTPDPLIRECSEKISNCIAQHTSSIGTDITLAVFAALKKEVDLSALHQHLPNARIAYPLCHSGNSLTFHVVKNLNELTSGMLGIGEPVSGKHAQVFLNEIDLILCPGLAYSRHGKRLGQGGGYYDRILAQRPATCRAWGVCLSSQLLEDIPTDEFDQPVDLIVTESEIITPTTHPVGESDASPS